MDLLPCNSSQPNFHRQHAFVFQLSELEDLDDDVDELIQEFEVKCQRHMLHTVVFC